ncbi:ATP-binding cassette domain-containing protein [Polycladomyces subterraneus]|uniref:ATP-binding cassette domain-containing protein n=1 Tax=Polycladomyces subterraneus TaxID=1016997 RepID=A0ABT8IMD8_9BACL|nr:ATP-binding cassette domain-containing protein [Polycladomyces subterraneus]MDN4593943.1 ATP-binding cassette domain-containing protein [Polycladomyces subterraneus]
MHVLTFSGVEKSYGDRIVLKNVEIAIREMERVGVVGANGAGKSTLLKLAVRKVEPDQGSVKIAPGVRIGYLRQTMEEANSYTLGEWLEQASSFLRDIEIRMERLAQGMASATGEELDRILSEYGELAARFERMGGYERDVRIQTVLTGVQMNGFDLNRPISTLSGGQKARIGLAALLIAAPDLLVMDEPTNHLDADTLSWLEVFLQQYRGTVLIASHDRGCGKSMNTHIRCVLIRAITRRSGGKRRRNANGGKRLTTANNSASASCGNGSPHRLVRWGTPAGKRRIRTNSPNITFAGGWKTQSPVTCVKPKRNSAGSWTIRFPDRLSRYSFVPVLIRSC